MKILALDIDGTITDQHRRIDCNVVETVRRLDMPVALATGNIVCFASTTAKLVGTSGIIIAENGGVVKPGFDTKECILGDIAQCQRAFDLLKTHFKLDKLDSEYRKTEIAVRRNFDLNEARTILSRANLGVNIADSGFAFHIKSKHINKGTGLKRVAELMDWSLGDIIAIGDSENDIEMLRTAGLGVAVGNAVPELKALADFVTKGEYGAGVIEAIKRFI